MGGPCVLAGEHARGDVPALQAGLASRRFRVETLEAYLDDRQIRPDEVDPIPIGVFLDYADWFTQRKGLSVHDEFVTELQKPNGRLDARLANGERVLAESVMAAPGIRHYTHAPDRAASLPRRSAGVPLPCQCKSARRRGERPGPGIEGVSFDAISKLQQATCGATWLLSVPSRQ